MQLVGSEWLMGGLKIYVYVYVYLVYIKHRPTPYGGICGSEHILCCWCRCIADDAGTLCFVNSSKLGKKFMRCSTLTTNERVILGAKGRATKGRGPDT